MAEDHSAYKHDKSDKKLDHSADATDMSEKSAAAPHAGHDEAEIRKHNDAGKDRMFEGREQRDDADMKSEKNRLAKDQDRHHHAEDASDAVTESNMHVKHKD